MMTAERFSKMTSVGRRHYAHNIMVGQPEIEIEAPAKTAASLLQRAAWEIEVKSPKTGNVKTFKKYFSKKQEVVIIGETTNGTWQTLWKEDLQGNRTWESSSPVAKWLRACVASPTLPQGLTFIKECHCRFCHKDLSHPASKFAGYGPICAEKYGLPWGQES